jgi:hypothetical protein
MRGVLLRMRAHGRPAAVSTLTVALATNQLASAATILTSGTSFIIFFTRVSGTSFAGQQAQQHHVRLATA